MTMNFHILTLFPEMFGGILHSSMLGRAEEKGIINGYNDGTFAPKALSSRAEAAVVIYRVINALNK